MRIDILRASLITPPPYGHPLYEQRGSLQSDNYPQLVFRKSYRPSDASSLISVPLGVELRFRIQNSEFLKHLPHPIHGGYEGIDLGHSIVQGKGGAYGAGDAHALHQRLGAVVAGAHGNAEAVEQGAHI